MLDNPEKTARLIAALKSAAPFQVALMPDLIDHLASQQKPVVVKPLETVSDVSYLGDEGASFATSSPGSQQRDHCLAHSRASGAPYIPLSDGRAGLSETSSEEAEEAKTRGMM